MAATFPAVLGQAGAAFDLLSQGQHVTGINVYIGFLQRPAGDMHHVDLSLERVQPVYPIGDCHAALEPICRGDTDPQGLFFRPDGTDCF